MKLLLKLLKLLKLKLKLHDYDVAVDKFDFAPVQSPDMRSSRCKKIFVQGDEPQKRSVKFLFWGQRGNSGGQNKKIEDKNRFAAYTFFKHVKQFYKLKGL